MYSSFSLMLSRLSNDTFSKIISPKGYSMLSNVGLSYDSLNPVLKFFISVSMSFVSGFLLK